MVSFTLFRSVGEKIGIANLCARVLEINSRYVLKGTGIIGLRMLSIRIKSPKHLKKFCVFEKRLRTFFVNILKLLDKITLAGEGKSVVYLKYLKKIILFYFLVIFLSCFGFCFSVYEY